MRIKDFIYDEDDGDPELLFFEFIFEYFDDYFFSGLVEYAMLTVIARGSIFLDDETVDKIFFVTNRKCKEFS